jgi:hypothetical protein
MPIGSLVRFGGIFRKAFKLQAGMVRGVHYEQGTPDIRRAFLRAIRREGTNWLVVATAPEWPDAYIEPVTDESGSPASLDLDCLLPRDVDRINMILVVIDLNARLSRLFDDP